MRKKAKRPRAAVSVQLHLRIFLKIANFETYSIKNQKFSLSWLKKRKIYFNIPWKLLVMQAVTQSFFAHFAVYLAMATLCLAEATQKWVQWGWKIRAWWVCENPNSTHFCSSNASFLILESVLWSDIALVHVVFTVNDCFYKNIKFMGIFGKG